MASGNHNPNYTPEMRKKAIKMVYETSASYEAIAAELGVTKGALGYWVRTDIPDKDFLAKRRDENYRREWREGWYGGRIFVHGYPSPYMAPNEASERLKRLKQAAQLVQQGSSKAAACRRCGVATTTFFRFLRKTEKNDKM